MAVVGPILVFLANGVQGEAVMRAAVRRGHVARGMVRNPHIADLSKHAVSGDLDDPASLVVAMRGMAHLVMQIPTGPEAVMVRRIASALDAARQTGIHSFVLKLASASRTSPCSEPSFVANAAIEALMKDAGIPFAVVRPTMYLDNLLKPSVLADLRQKGVFAPPVATDQAVAWTSADDCAEAAIRLLEHGCDHGDYLIAGGESVTGDMLAARISEGLQRPVRYEAQSVAAFERELAVVMGADAAGAVAGKFRYFRDQPDDADRILATPFQPCAVLKGFVPTVIADWVRARRDRFDIAGTVQESSS